MLNLKVLFLFTCIYVYDFYVSLNVLPSHPIPILSVHACKRLVVRRIMPKHILSYKYVTFDLIKITLLAFLWVLLLSSNIIFVEVKFVNFRSNLSVCSRCDVNKQLSRHTLQFWVYSFTFLALLEPFILLFMLDNTYILCFPRKHTLIILKRYLYSKIHRACFLTYKCLIGLMLFFVSWFMAIPCATLWYFQLVISMSNDISENPGPQYANQINGASPYFSFCNWNLNTLSKDKFSRISLLDAHNSIYKYDIISLCETSLSKDEIVPENILPGYHYHACNHPSGEKKGGVGIFYKDSLPIKIRSDLSFDECIVAELRFGWKKIFFTVLYRNPMHKATSPEFYNFLENFRNLYSKILSEKPYFSIFTGDLNAHSVQWWLNGDSNNEGTQLDILFSELGLTQLISEPTHFRDHCLPSCIDLIICDQPNLVIDSGVRPSLDHTCKHQITFCKLSIKSPRIPPSKRLVWHYDKAKRDLINRAITDFPWERHLNEIQDPNSQVKFLNQTILNIISNFVPSSTMTSNINEPKWITRNIKNLLSRQKKLYKKYRLNGFKADDKVSVDRIRDECFKAITTSKENYLKSLGNKLIDKGTGPKAYWNIINSLLNKCKIPRIPPLLVADKIITDFKEKVKLFNDYFLAQCKPIVNNSTLPLFTQITHSNIDTIVISQKLILDIIKNLNTNKAHGPDNISGRMIELCGDNITLPLGIIFKNIINTGIFPNLWKSANVTPVHKKDSKQVVKNYRPISLLPLFAKIFERILFSKMYNHFISNNLITKNQSGFRPNDSVTNQLICLVDSIHSSFDINLDVRSVFLDMSKAFDKVWHEGLLFKLEQNGINGKLLDLLRSYLSNRKQRVLLNGTESEWGDIESGVPQGSVLGPLLFLIYINDLEIGIKSHIKFFADDTSLFSIVKDPNTSACELNQDLKLISQWAKQWKMSFNPDPTKQAVQVVFSRKHKKIDHPKIYFNDIEVKTVDEHKHLGLTLDAKLTFASHINDKLSNARKGLGIIKSLSRYLSVKTLNQIYKLYIRPHLDFCDVIYHVPCITNPFDSSINLNYLMNTLERIQYHAALAITGTWKGTNLNKIYNELGWETLTERRWSRRLFHFYKIQNNLAPPYMKIPLPPPRNYLYSIRSENILNEISCNSDSYRNSFYPDSIRCWNRIGHKLRNSLNLKSFKASILALVRPSPKSIFDIHDSLGIKWLFQLRVGLSPLNEHKNNHNFIDTPSDKCIVCKRSENLEHFFLHCTRFIESRKTLLDLIQSLDVNFRLLQARDKIKLLLYGNSSLNYATNRLLLKATLKFLHDSKRFS